MPTDRSDAARRPRLLALAQCYPFPPDSGVTNRTFNVLCQLQREFDVTLIAFSRRNHQPDAASRERAWHGLQQHLHAADAPFPIPAEQSVLRRASDHLRSVVERRPYVYHEYRSAAFAAALARASREVRPDIVHLDSLDLFGWLPQLPQAPVACTHHSIESSLLRIQATRVSNRLVRAYVEHQANLLETIERSVCPRLALNVMVSDLDAERLHELAPTARTTVAPNGVDTAYFGEPVAATQCPGRVVFVGPTYSFPNRDAVEWTLADIWPLIRTQMPAATLALVGGGAQERLDHYRRHPGVSALGQVPDVRIPLAEATCCIVPIRAGGGTRLKILDAWAAGRAVVSTTIGCEGLAVREGENILIRDRPAEMAAAVREVAENAGLRRRLETEGRKTAEQRYSWEAIGSTLRRNYHEIVGRTSDADPSKPKPG